MAQNKRPGNVYSVELISEVIMTTLLALHDIPGHACNWLLYDLALREHTLTSEHNTLQSINTDGHKTRHDRGI